MIERVTPRDLPLVDYEDGSVIEAADLDLGVLQNLYICEEILDELEWQGNEVDKLWTAYNELKSYYEAFRAEYLINHAQLDAKVEGYYSTLTSVITSLRTTLEVVLNRCRDYAVKAEDAAYIAGINAADMQAWLNKWYTCFLPAIQKLLYIGIYDGNTLFDDDSNDVIIDSNVTDYNSGYIADGQGHTEADWYSWSDDALKLMAADDNAHKAYCEAKKAMELAQNAKDLIEETDISDINERIANSFVNAEIDGTTLSLIKGNGDTVEVTTQDTTYNNATTTSDGLMSYIDKTKLDNIASGANNYVHPAYTALTGKPFNNVTPNFGETVTVSQISTDTTGHVTSLADKIITIPNATATTVNAGLMSAQDKAKLDAVASNANNYVHPTTEGNKHIPSGGSNGQILRWSAAGTAEWGADNNTTYNKATQSADGLLSKEDKTIIDNLDNTYAKLTGTLADNPITRTSPSGHTASLMQHGYTVGDEAEICDIGWDFANRDGAMLGLNSASKATGAGAFSLVARNATDSSQLNGLPDGTLQWNNNTVLTTANGLPLSGGTLTGVLNTKDIYLDNASIRSKLDTQNINVYGGTGWQHGAYLGVCGKDEPNSPGYFYLRADNGVANKTLQGRPDGTLMWDNRDVATIQTGTWTPTLYGATTTGAFSYTTRVGKYCKIGQLVYIYANLQCNCTTAPVGQACINGIPFSCEDESGAGGFSILTSGAGTSYSLKRLCGLNIKSNYIILRITNEGDNTVDNANFNPNDSSSYNLKIPSGQSIVLEFSAVYRTTQ